MNKYKKLNIVNVAELTNWFKAFTWGDESTAITYADIKNREFVAANSEPVAKLMVHSYIKKNISYYFNPYAGSEILTPVQNTAELSSGVCAAIAAGYPAYNFHPAKVSPRMQNEIRKLNDYLRNAALQYINQQVSQKSGEFNFDIRYLDNKFKDVMAAVNRAKWDVKMPEKETVQPQQNIAFMTRGHEKD